MDEDYLGPYLDRLVDTLKQELKDNLHAVYLFGSASYGAYEPGSSDVDVYAVIYNPEPEDNYDQIARQLSHASLPCPARKLEFVLFTKANAALSTSSPQFAMNFNTGRYMVHDYINTDPATEPPFWFLIDIAMGRELGMVLFGPPPGSVFAAPRVEWVLDCILESLEWHRRNSPLTSDSILNACRGLRFAKAGEWGSKMEGGAWVIRIGCYGEHGVVALAMDARRSKKELPQDQALKLLDTVQAEVKECRSNIS